jgi:hypothetical protein
MGITSASQEIPVRIVGSSVFGRYPTISVERTYNLFITSSGDGEEEWLANFSGYSAIMALFDTIHEGRGFYHSVRGDFVLVVVGAVVFRINSFNEIPTQLGTIGTDTGEVFFDENLSSQICFVDGQTAYIYNYELAATTIGPAVYDSHGSDFQPNYVTYQNTYFIFGNALTTNAGSQWVIYEQNTASTAYSLKWVQTLTLQTKPDFAKAVLRIPGKGNNIIVFGSTVAELWTNVGGLQIYQRQSSINIDYGAISVSTIAANDEVVCWLGVNENSSPALMVMTGGGASRISTDGFDYLLETVKVPSASTAFLYRQGGHLFYVLSFIDPKDNFSIMYDFTKQKFYDLTDWDFSAFPPRKIVYFKNNSYFLSYKDGQIYQISSDFTEYDLTVNQDGSMVNKTYQIPCVRVTNTYRLQRPEKFKVNLFTFIIESGTTLQAYDSQVCFGYILTEDTHVPIYTEDGLPILVEGGYCYTNKPRVDLTISKNGGLTFSNTVSYTLKATGQFQNQPRFINLGYAQQITYELRIWSSGRKVIKNGMMEVGQ